MEYKGYTIKVEQDDDALDPCREFDQLGTMVFWHRRMNLGHEYEVTSKVNPDEWFRDRLRESDYAPDEWLENVDMDMLKYAFELSNLLIPVYAYEHGGITIKAHSKGMGWDSWDSGQLGFIYVSHEKIKEEYEGETFEDALAKAEKCLLAEVEAYDDYLTGNVYGYIVEDEDGEHLDSCWGFYGYDGREEAESQAKSFVDWQVEQDSRQPAG